MVTNDCPCKIISVDEVIKLNSFSAASDRHFIISLDEFRDNFIKCPVEDSYITKLDKYPDGKIHESEFTKREEVKKLKKQMEKFKNPITQ